MRDLSDFVVSARKQLSSILGRSGNVLYSAARTLSPGPVYLLGLNPGGDPSRHETIGETLERLPSRSSNAYLHETWERRAGPGHAPLQRRVRWLIEQLGLNVEDVCAANLIFTRSRDASGSEYPRLAHLCWPTHVAILDIVRPKLIVAYGNSDVSPYAYLRSQLNGSSEELFPSGHGTWQCRAFPTAGTWVVGLPHLSRYAVDRHPAMAGRLRRWLAA